MRFFLLLVAALFLSCSAFSPSFIGARNKAVMTGVVSFPRSTILHNSEKGGEEGEKDSEASAKLTLEEKMKNWQATEEEVKAATLGGVVPSEERSDAFDVGLYILFPFMVLGGLAVAFFPLIVGNIDTSSLGPPPTS